MDRDFEKWFKEHEFYHDNTAREGIERALETGRDNGISQALLLDMFDEIIYVMRNEYGD